MNRSSMSKQMMQEGGPVVPSKEEFEAMSPKEKAARKKKAMMQNINLSPKEKMDTAPRPKPKDPRAKGSAMPMMKKGGKVRGAGMAKKGVRTCKMR